MDLANKIDAYVTTFDIDLKNVDFEIVKNENEKLMSFINNMELNGVEQPLFNDKLNTIG